MKPWLSNEDLAERYGIPIATVRKWRHMKTGPAGVRLNGAVRYAAEVVLAWEREQAEKAS